MLDLGGFYGLHPALANLHAMYRAGEALAVHAVAGPYRARSHFEAQDCLESGTDHRMTSGWLNRALGRCRQPTPPARRWQSACRCRCCCVDPANVASWAPHGIAALDADLYARIAALNQDDRVLGPAIAEGLRERGFSAAVLSGDEPAHEPLRLPRSRQGRRRDAACRRRPARRRTGDRRLGHPCGSDAAPGRRAAPTRCRAGGAEDGAQRGMAADRGADHDRVRPDRTNERHRRHRPWDRHGGVRAGGAVSGGRVVADWPGLGPGRLFEDRDLQPTVDLRAVAKGLLARHLGLVSAAVAFPDAPRPNDNT